MEAQGHFFERNLRIVSAYAISKIQKRPPLYIVVLLPSILTTNKGVLLVGTGSLAFLINPLFMLSQERLGGDFAPVQYGMIGFLALSLSYPIFLLFKKNLKEETTVWNENKVTQINVRKIGTRTQSWTCRLLSISYNSVSKPDLRHFGLVENVGFWIKNNTDLNESVAISWMSVNSSPMFSAKLVQICLVTWRLICRGRLNRWWMCCNLCCCHFFIENFWYFKIPPNQYLQS